MRHVVTVIILLAGAAVGGATWYFRAPTWGYLVAAVVFAVGLATWPRRAGDDAPR